MTAAASRGLTPSEIDLARSVFGDAVDYGRVRVHPRKWFPFQPGGTVMAPDGHIWIPPKSGLWRDDFAAAPLALQSLFIHEMTHVWQAQRRGRWYLPLARHPFCRYKYKVVPGRRFERYGIEQQAEIVRHAFLMRRGPSPAGAPAREELESILPFGAPA